MVRKIFKSKRHKKLKAVDPFYFGDRKLFIDKGLVGANRDPDKNSIDEQNVPSKMREYFELDRQFKAKQLVETHAKVQKRKIEQNKMKAILFTKPDEKGAEVPFRPVNKMKKSESESESAFLNRVDHEVENVINRSKFEAQYNCKLETDGERIIVKKEKKMSDKKRKRLEKLKDKIKTKKDNRRSDTIDRRLKEDNVRFGEIVHQPPMLTTLPKITRKYESCAANIKNEMLRPGKKNLLLKGNSDNNDGIINGNNQVRIKFSNETRSSNYNGNKLVDKNSKSNISENDRQAVIDRYRKLKKTGVFK